MDLRLQEELKLHRIVSHRYPTQRFFFSGLRGFWTDKEDSYLIHRGIIAIKDNFTLQPKNGTLCQERNVSCALKQDRSQDISLDGNCRRGWTIEVLDVWNSSSSTKLVCETQAKAKWHFYVFPFGKTTIYFPRLRKY